ncbi:MAG: hypothetical protein ABFS34_03375 [Gemmatimonadota bacterium]
MSLRVLDRYVRALRDDLAALEVPQDLGDRFGGYRDRPADFVREQLGASPETYQVEMLEACAENSRVALRSGHGVGKTAILAWVLLWWLLTRPFSRALMLAPSFERQVGAYLLPEVKKWVRRAPDPLPLTVRALSVEVTGYGREWFALGVQASDPALVEGAHAESLCILADEAKALSADVIAALHGTQTDREGDRLYVMASTPGGPSGPFYDAFRKGSGIWRTFHVSAEDSALVSPEWVAERAEEWGRASPLYEARVLGEFPDEAEGTLIRLADLEAAVGRRLEQEDPKTFLGVDCARFGEDKSALAVWCGQQLLGVTTIGKLDTMEVASWVASEINRRQPAQVGIDEIGLGSGVVDRLRQLGHHVAKGINVGRRAEDRPDVHANVRAEIFWKLREGLERGEVSLPDDPQLIAELSAIRYGYTPSGQIRLEEKAETKKRVGHSPDRADAAALGYYFTIGGVDRRLRFFRHRV